MITIWLLLLICLPGQTVGKCGADNLRFPYAAPIVAYTELADCELRRDLEITGYGYPPAQLSCEQLGLHL
jgi:hypothetical protein